MQRYEASQTLQAFEEEEDEARAELYAEEDAAITKEGGDLQVCGNATTQQKKVKRHILQELPLY